MIISKTAKVKAVKPTWGLIYHSVYKKKIILNIFMAKAEADSMRGYFRSLCYNLLQKGMYLTNAIADNKRISI